MTAENRAKELVETFAETLPSVFYNQIEERNWHSAKKCALICVDEILGILFQHHEIDYWKAVKEETSKLT